MIGLANKEKLESHLFTAIYTTKEGIAYIKRFKIDKFLTNKTYEFIPEKTKIQLFTLKTNSKIKIKYKPAPRLKVLEEEFDINKYQTKGYAAKGVRLSTKPIQKAQLL